MTSSVGMIIPNYFQYMESHKSHVPNHQPAIFLSLHAGNNWAIEFNRVGPLGCRRSNKCLGLGMPLEKIYLDDKQWTRWWNHYWVFKNVELEVDETMWSQKRTRWWCHKKMTSHESIATPISTNTHIPQTLSNLRQSPGKAGMCFLVLVPANSGAAWVKFHESGCRTR